jgi:hypothetical protein
MRPIRHIVRQTLPACVALLVGVLVAKFIDLEVWLVNQSPSINGADLLALLLFIGFATIINKSVTTLLKGSDT